MGWKRWIRYGKAKVAAAARDLDDTVERKEAELQADHADKPWLADDDDAPTFDEATARIEATTGRTGEPSGNPTFDMAEEQRAADERLAEIRRSLGLDDDADNDPRA
jgi:hypothetical protein